MKAYQFNHQEFINSLTPEQCAYLGAMLAEDKGASFLWLNAQKLERLCFERIISLSPEKQRELGDKMGAEFAGFVENHENQS